MITDAKVRSEILGALGSGDLTKLSEESRAQLKPDGSLYRHISGMALMGNQQLQSMGVTAQQSVQLRRAMEIVKNQTVSMEGHAEVEATVQGPKPAQTEVKQETEVQAKTTVSGQVQGGVAGEVGGEVKVQGETSQQIKSETSAQAGTEAQISGQPQVGASTSATAEGQVSAQAGLTAKIQLAAKQNMGEVGEYLDKNRDKIASSDSGTRDRILAALANGSSDNFSDADKAVLKKTLELLGKDNSAPAPVRVAADSFFQPQSAPAVPSPESQPAAQQPAEPSGKRSRSRRRPRSLYRLKQNSLSLPRLLRNKRYPKQVPWGLVL